VLWNDRRRRIVIDRIALIARLKDGAEERARELLRRGPPFDLQDAGLVRHVVYLSAREVVFVFEGPEVEWALDERVDEPFTPMHDALEEWKPLVEMPPRIARPEYVWERS
jgi:hypothetical protein